MKSFGVDDPTISYDFPGESEGILSTLTAGENFKDVVSSEVMLLFSEELEYKSFRDFSCLVSEVSFAFWIAASFYFVLKSLEGIFFMMRLCAFLSHWGRVFVPGGACLMAVFDLGFCLVCRVDRGLCFLWLRRASATTSSWPIGLLLIAFLCWVLPWGTVRYCANLCVPVCCR